MHLPCNLARVECHNFSTHVLCSVSAQLSSRSPLGFADVQLRIVQETATRSFEIDEGGFENMWKMASPRSCTMLSQPSLFKSYVQTLALACFGSVYVLQSTISDVK